MEQNIFENAFKNKFRAALLFARVNHRKGLVNRPIAIVDH